MHTIIENFSDILIALITNSVIIAILFKCLFMIAR